MGRTYRGDGSVLTILAPSGGLTVNVPKFIGNLFVIPKVTAAEGLPAAVVIEGLAELPKTSAQAWAVGEPLYWDIANARLDNTAVGPRVGEAAEVAANPSSTGVVKLGGAGNPRIFASGEVTGTG